MGAGLTSNSCHQLQNMTANQANAGFNRQNASANRDNADANRQNAAANRENLVMQRAILNQLQTMSKQNKDLGKHQDKLQATQRQTGIESAVGTRMIDDMEKLRLSSLDIESTAKRRMSVVLPMTAVNASIVDENVLPSSPGGSNPESNVQQREALPAVFEDQDQDEVLAEASGRAGKGQDSSSSGQYLEIQLTPNAQMARYLIAPKLRSVLCLRSDTIHLTTPCALRS